MQVLNGPERFIDLLKPPFRYAFFVGCFLWILQQLTGINAVIFYSSFIFSSDSNKLATEDNSHMTEKIGTMAVGIVNWVSALLGVYMVHKFGRKILLFYGMIGMSISLTLLAYLYKIKQIWVILSCVFIIFFEISIGPIMWLYIAEIMTPRGAGFAYGLNWIFVIIFAIISSLLFKDERQQNSYLGLSIFWCIGIFFILHYVRESKGLSPYRWKRLYFPNIKQ